MVVPPVFCQPSARAFTALLAAAVTVDAAAAVTDAVFSRKVLAEHMLQLFELAVPLFELLEVKPWQ